MNSRGLGAEGFCTTQHFFAPLIWASVLLLAACGPSGFFGGSEEKENRIPHDTDKPGDNGEGVPGYLVDPTTITIEESTDAEGNTQISVTAPAGTVVASARNLPEIAVGFYQVALEQLTGDADPAAPLTGDLLGTLFPDNEGALAGDVALASESPVVIHVMVAGAEPETISLSPSAGGQTQSAFYLPGRNEGVKALSQDLFPAAIFAGAFALFDTNGSAPTARYGHTATWSEQDLLIFGGIDYESSAVLADGSRYNPTTRTWQAMATADAATSYHSGVWTGTQLIVFGGTDQTALNTGGLYDPATDTWNTIADLPNTPRARSHHTAVWDGNKMLVWGGQDENGTLASGATFQPTDSSWQPMASTDADRSNQTPRSQHTSTMVGSQMVVFGGDGGSSGQIAMAGTYTPVEDTWRAESAPIAVTTGKKLYSQAISATKVQVLGISEVSGTPLFGRFDTSTNNWESMSVNGFPAISQNATLNNVEVVWYDTTPLVIWADSNNLVSLLRFDGDSNTWSQIAQFDGIAASGFQGSLFFYGSARIGNTISVPLKLVGTEANNGQGGVENKVLEFSVQP